MKNIWRIITIAKPQRGLIIAVSALILIGAILQQLSPLLLKSIVDVIQSQLTRQTGDLTTLYRLLGLTLAVNIISVVLSSASDRLGDAVSARISNYLVNRFYRHVLQLPQTYFDSVMSGKIANQLTRGIISIGDFIGTMTNFILPAILQTLLMFGMLSYYSLPIGLLSISIFPFYILVSYISTKRWGSHEVQKNALEDRYKSRIVEVIQNMKLVKTANTQTYEMDQVGQVTEAYQKLYDHQSSQYHWLNFLRNGGLELIIIIIVLITFNNTYKGVFSLGVMVLILQLLSQLRRPLFAMSFILERIQRAEAGAKEFFEILSLPTTEALTLPTHRAILEVPITMENVSFTYDTAPILTRVNLEIKPRETVALIGPSGAGKTTLVNLLLKLYEPTAGLIKLGDKQYNKLAHSYVRSHFSYVFQDNELFSSTIGDNIAYGHQVPKTKITQALKAAYIYDFVSSLPQGLATEIGEKGLKLSGGQKQRLQIARALVDPAPVLILDEATSSLDAKSEAIIQNALIALTKQKTVIIIAHRFSTLQHVNRIIVIDKGKIVDQGSPQELANRPGIFKELLRYQIEGNQKLLQKYELTG